MATTTPMMIRVQANGGKFLADDIGGAEVTVRDARTGRWLDGGRVQGPDSGTLQQSYVPSASRSAIVTPGTPPLVQWLVPGPTTSGLTVHLPITQPTLLEVEVYGPLGGLQSAQRAVTYTWAANARCQALIRRQQLANKARCQALIRCSNWPTGGWPIARSGQASAKARMYLRFEREKLLISGNATRRSAEQGDDPGSEWRVQIGRRHS